MTDSLLLANEGLSREEDSQKDKYLIFKIGEEEYAIGIACVTEIIGLMKITDVPDMPDFIKGVINLRGKVIPIMDVRRRFGKAERAYDDRTCIIVVSIEGTIIGWVVDRVAEVEDIPEENIDPAPRIHHAESRHFIQGMGKIGDEVKIILDPSKILYSEELDQITKMENE